MAFLSKSGSVAGPGYSRWLIPPAALAVHLSIGQVYAFSVFKNSLVERFDTSGTAIAWIFSIAIVMLGLSAAVLGTWVERSGPRKAMFTAACFWASGFLVGALGIAIGFGTGNIAWFMLAVIASATLLCGGYALVRRRLGWKPLNGEYLFDLVRVISPP